MSKGDWFIIGGIITLGNISICSGIYTATLHGGLCVCGVCIGIVAGIMSFIGLCSFFIPVILMIAYNIDHP